ncbi:hypothetical protein L218DRAFT_950638 [Marasmius fiardii PR-910]|nr:hypothetical protein L218DRAFT_950638 [Marasmius fiardii PR-910]
MRADANYVDKDTERILVREKREATKKFDLQLTVFEKHDTVSSFMTPHQVERTKHGRQLAAQFVLDKARGGLAAGTPEYSPQTGIQVLGLSGNWTTVNQRKNANFWVVEAMMIAGAGVRESVA